MDFYNDNNADCAEQIKYLVDQGLIPDGVVSSQDVRLVEPSQLRGFNQVHLFAGIGGWPRAVSLAGCEHRRLWTCSCPCQPFSTAGNRRGSGDERHLWPDAYRLIKECRPPVIFGEQVAAKDGLLWFESVRNDLEEIGYAVAAADLPACCVGAPHLRQRVYWVADASGELRDDPPAERAVADTHRLGDAQQDGSGSPGGCGRIDTRSWWNPEPAMDRVVNGIPEELGPTIHMLGNAIVPQLAAEFMSAFYETREQ